MPPTSLTGKSSDLLRVVLPAAARGDQRAVKRFLRDDWTWLYQVGPHGRTMLWEAAYKRRLPTVKLLIEAGADVNSPGTYYTPLIVDLTPYCLARRAGDDALADLLVQNGAALDLHSAAYLGDLRYVKRVLERHPQRVNDHCPAPQPTPLDRGSVTAPLTKAIEQRLGVIERKLARTLKPDIEQAHRVAAQPRTRWEAEAALMGIESRYFQAVGELAQLIQQVVAGRHTGRTAPVRRRLLWRRRKAIDRWQRAVFREAHAGVHDHRPVHYAVVANQVDVAAYLIEKGAVIRPYSKKLIEVASGFRDGRLLDLLLQHGADVSLAVDPSWAEHPQLMKLAKQSGVKLDFEQEAGKRPALVEACTANMNARDDPARVSAILDRGCPVDIRDRHGKTGLHRAARAGFVEITQLLIDRGADLEAKDHDGETPLFDAVRAGRLAAAQLLAERGASVAAKNDKGTTVEQVARRARRNEAAEVRAWLATRVPTR